MDNAHFNRLVDTPERWFAVAEQHCDAARVLWVALLEAASGKRTPEKERRSIGCLRGFLAMVAASAENAIKAVIVHQGKHRDPSGNLVRNIFQGHKLVNLCATANLPINVGETEFLNKLTEYAEWAGRFPDPLTAERRENAIKNNIHTAGLHHLELLEGMLLWLKPAAGWDNLHQRWPDADLPS